MSDYRLVIRVKNNLLHTLMKEKGIETQAELARAAGLHPGAVGDIANLKIGAFYADGRPSNATEKLCEYFGCLPEDIYPAEVLYTGIPSNVIERAISSGEVAKYLQQTESDPAFQLENMIDSEFIRDQLNRLTPRQKQVVEARFFDEKNITETASDIGVTSARVRAIEDKAIERLQQLLKHESGEHNSDSTAAGLATRFANAVKNENTAKARSAL